MNVLAENRKDRSAGKKMHSNTHMNVKKIKFLMVK